MRVILYVFGLICFSASYGIAQKTTKQPVLMSFDKEHIALGKVKRGEVRNFEYTFVNSGTDVIQIDQVSSCSCTKTDYPTRKIQPGQKATIKVTFDSTEKEKSETVDVDIYLKNIDPKTDAQILKILTYSFELVK